MTVHLHIAPPERPAAWPAEALQLRLRCLTAVQTWTRGRDHMVDGRRIRPGAPMAMVRLLPGRLDAAEQSVLAWVDALEQAGLPRPALADAILSWLARDRAVLARALSGQARGAYAPSSSG